MVTAGALLVGCSNDDSASDGEIKVMVVGQFDNPVYALPEGRDTAEAAVDRINSEGGVDGRNIRLVVCDDNRDPNGAGKCARDAVSQNVAAVLSAQTNYATNMQPILAAAEIPYIRYAATQLADLTDPNTWPILAGNIAGGGAAGIAMAKDGCRHVSVARYDADSSKALEDAYTEGYKSSGGAKVAEAVVVAAGAPDVAPIVANYAAQGVDCLGLAVGPADVLKIAQSIKQAGAGIRIYNLAQGYPQDVLDSLDGKVELRAASDLPPLDDPSLEQFRADAAEAGAPLVVTAAHGWTLVHVFAQVVATIDGDIDGPAVTEALQNMKALKLPGLPDVDLTQSSPVPDLPRVFNTFVYVLSVDGTKLVADGEPVDTSSFFKAFVAAQ